MTNVRKDFSKLEVDEINCAQNVGVKDDLLNAKRLYFTCKLLFYLMYSF